MLNTEVFWGLILWILELLQVSRDPVQLILGVLVVFRHLVLLILSILESISGFCTASNTASVAAPRSTQPR